LYLFSLLFGVAYSGVVEDSEKVLSGYWSAKCSTCEFIVENLRTLPARSHIQAIAKLCPQTPVPHCAEKMKHSLGSIQAALLEEKSSSSICNQLAWCRRGSVFQLPQPEDAPDHSLAEIHQDLSCAFCQKAFAAVQNMLDSGKLPGGVEAATLLAAFCSQIPQTHRAACSRVNVTNLADIFSGTASESCSKMEMCRSHEMVFSLRHHTIHVATPNQFSGARCQGCQWAVSAIEAYFAQDTTTDELSRILQELCTVLPGDYAEVCQNFVLVYTTQALGWMIDNLTPPVVCEQISFCPSPQ